jgi:hypothetical protein
MAMGPVNLPPSVLAAIRLDDMTGSWLNELDNDGSVTPIAKQAG